jgi:lipopolysaccharide assembly outer membrane protein LptD (OstA)
LYNNGLSLGPLAEGGFQSRELIYGRAGVASEIEKVYNLDWGPLQKLKHTIEPFATYAYVPNVDQGSLPLFDDTDRIEGRSLLSYGATSRIFLKLAPRRPAQGEAAEAPSSEDQIESYAHPFMARSFVNGSTIEEILRVSLMQAYDITHAVAQGSTRFSDLDLIATAFPTNTWSVGGQMTYSPQVSTIHYASTYLNFQPWWTRGTKVLTGSNVQLNYIFIGPGPQSKPGVNATYSQFMAVRAYYELFNRVSALFAPLYDFSNHRLLTTEYGLRIKPLCSCWAFDVGVTDTINPSETQFQFQLTLGGLGSVGKSPFGHLPFQSRMGVLPNS